MGSLFLNNKELLLPDYKLQIAVLMRHGANILAVALQVNR
jgi:hypothetical protein